MLLRVALSHRSWVSEHPGEESNERLEFLGDAVLGWLVAEWVFHRHPELTEGRLTDLRKAVVNAGALASVADQLGLGEVLFLGKGEAAAGGRAKPSILSDALEAVLAAVYLDGGPDAARALVARLLGPALERAARFGGSDHKTALQEQLARRASGPPAYRVAEDGPDHAKVFQARVLVGDEELGSGTGRSKKQAEQAAAAQALQRMAPGAPDGTGAGA